MIGRTLAPVAPGLAVGVALALALSRLVHNLLFGIEPTDTLTLATGTAILLVAALAAAWLPAHRASRVDPLESLRRE